MNSLPVYIAILFLLTVILTVFLFYKAANHSKKFLLLSITWIIVQSTVAITGFYTKTNTLPPRFIFLMGPVIIGILLFLLSKKFRQKAKNMSLKYLTLLQVVRIPVEITLYLLFINDKIPGMMTFGGLNFDILSGISAPIAWWLYSHRIAGYNKERFLFTWNIICLLLLFVIVYIAVFSAPFVFQQFAFDQPNIAILYFPFILLPGLIVPLVLFSHMVSILHLLTNRSERKIIE